MTRKLTTEARPHYDYERLAQRMDGKEPADLA